MAGKKEVDQDLVAYVKSTLDMGFSKKKIKEELVKAGHTPKAINLAFEGFKGSEKSGSEPKTISIGMMKILKFVFIGLFAVIVIFGVIYFVFFSSGDKPVETTDGEINFEAEMELCAAEGSLYDQNWCYFQLSTQVKDAAICDNIVQPELNFFCMAQTNDDPSFCEKITFEKVAAKCFEVVR